MPKIKIDGKVCHAEQGELLSKILIREGFDVDHPCGGMGKCGKCTVIVNGKNELSCRYKICGDCVVELQNKGELFCLYDDFGKLTLKNTASMKLDILIDAETAENFDYTSTIDSNTYNQIKLTYDNEEAGVREVYMARDGSKINQWGILQYFEKLQKNENGQAKADALLSLYNKKTRNLKVDDCFGDVRCRAGSMPVVQLNLGDVKLSNYMLIEKATHTFKNNQHTMSLNLRGGEFVV